MVTRLNKLIQQVKSDARITNVEVDKLITTAKGNGKVSKAERDTLQQLLRNDASLFEPAAKTRLEGFLKDTTPPQPPPPPGPPGPPPPTTDPLTLMTQKLQAAAAGGLTGNELASAESAIAQTYGTDVAKKVLEQAVGARSGDLTIDGATWLQQKHGQLGGHVVAYQQALLTHLKDATLVDANFDGKLDAADQIFTKDATGKVNVQTVGAALCDKVKIGGAMIEACEEMNAKPHDFALIKDQTFNAALWQSGGNGTFTLKPGVKPSDAVKDIFANPDKYKFECATALVIVHYKAMLELLGPKDFDTACASLRMGPWQYESTMSTYWKQSGSEVSATDLRKGELHAGDYTYFKNWDVSDQGRDAGWQGENVISLGGDKYFGHPFGITTGKEIVEYLNQNRKTGSTRTADMLDLQARLDPTLLALDKTPGE